VVCVVEEVEAAEAVVASMGPLGEDLDQVVKEVEEVLSKEVVEEVMSDEEVIGILYPELIMRLTSLHWDHDNLISGPKKSLAG